jgi:hypothetical protein
LQLGDIILTINNVSAREAPFQTFAGKTINLTVKRDGAEIKMPMKVGSRSYTQFKLAPLPNASAQQMRVREGWLKR